MSAALQKAIRGRLVAAPALTALVDAANIVDRNGLPAVFPCIIMGDGQELDAELTLERRHVRAYSTLHVWDRSSSTINARAIVTAIRAALAGDLPQMGEGRLLDFRHAATRYLRDPDGKTVHAVVELEALIEEGRP